MKQIILLIEPDGQTTATADGFEGNSCRLATAFLSQVLGPVSAEKLTPAYYQQAMTTPAEQENRL